MRRWIIPLVIFLVLAYCYETRWKVIESVREQNGIVQWRLDKWTNITWVFGMDANTVRSQPLNIQDKERMHRYAIVRNFLSNASRILLVLSFAWLIVALYKNTPPPSKN